MSSRVQTASSTIDESSIIKILVATDIHLGYGEKNKILSNDSFTTFEEILEIANIREVDFILLGGDLFHDAKPSPKALNECIKLLRTYVMGDKPIDFEFLSDQNQNFPSSFHHSVNYEDSNLNVSVPVFTIHGNHDDNVGDERLGSMDILSSAGLINYFGKWQDLTKVKISPLVIKKNETKVALYGLSHISDKRLGRLFKDQLVKMIKPDFPDSEIFNLMVVHQNRVERGRLTHLPENELPSFLDLVVWGHEHDCRIEPEQNPHTETYITQPGSSVATSLCEGESIEKKVGILEIHKKDFKLKPVSLKTVRPFIFRSLNIDDHVSRLNLDEGDTKMKLEKFYMQNIEEMIEESQEKITGHFKQPTLPLIRLRVIYTNQDHSMNTVRFGQKYGNKVANPEEILLFKKKNKKEKGAKGENYNPDAAAMKLAFEKRQRQGCVEDVVENYFAEIKGGNELKAFNLKTLTEICRLYVRGDDARVDTVLKLHTEKAVEFLHEKNCDQDEIPENLQEFQLNQSAKTIDDMMSVRPQAKSSNARGGYLDTSTSSLQSKPSRGRGRGKGAKLTTGGGGRSKAAQSKKMVESPPKRSQTSRRTRNQTIYDESDESE